MADAKCSGAVAYVTVEIECTVGVWEKGETCEQLHNTALREGVQAVEHMVLEHNRRHTNMMRVINASGTKVVTRVEHG